MNKETITIEVSPEAARTYRSASPEERRRVQAVVATLLQDRETAARELDQIMDEMGRTARERDLTPEMLEQMLDEE